MFLVSIALSLILILILKFLIFDYEASYITEVIVYALFNSCLILISIFMQTQYMSIFLVFGVFILYAIVGFLVVLILRIISERLEGLAFMIIGLIMDFAVKYGVTLVLIFVLAAIMTMSKGTSLLNY